jgi:hypothetical protein
VKSPFCPSEELLVGFAAFLAESTDKKETGLTIGTIKRYVGAVKRAHDVRSLPWPTSLRMLEMVYRGIKKRNPGQVGLPRLPVTVALLEAILAADVLDFNKHEDRLLWAIMVIGVFGLFRGGELLPDAKKWPDLMLLPADFEVVNDTHVRVKLKKSKTNPWRLPVKVSLFRTGAPVCPISALHQLLSRRDPKIKNAPVFATADGCQLLKSRFVAMMRAAIEATEEKFGLSSGNAARYYGHSLRRGGATSLALRGVSEAMIRVMGRWRSWSYRVYIDLPDSALRDASTSMASITRQQRAADIGLARGYSAPCCSAWDE